MAKSCELLGHESEDNQYEGTAKHRIGHASEASLDESGTDFIEPCRFYMR